MTPGTRALVFLAGAAGLAAVFWGAFAGLPAVGDYRGPYGDLVNAITVPERNVTDTVTAVNFDIRGFDTLGEEFILFASVMGVLLLLRRQENEERQSHQDGEGVRAEASPSELTGPMALFLTPVIFMFGVSVVAHGQLTPGGGFQGGVILAAAPLFLYLAGGFRAFRRAVPRALVHLLEAAGAGSYAAIGFACVAAGGAFLQNMLPLGPRGSLLSGGTIALINAGVGLAVGSGLLLLFIAYLEETLELKEE